MTRWEYKFWRPTDEAGMTREGRHAEFQKFGDEGWELISIGTTGQVEYIFKRPKQTSA